MKALMHKELRLALHPTNVIFLFMAAMVLIPNYPYYVAPFFSALGVQFLCLTGRENGDVLFTLLLPVSRRDAVKARFLTAMLFELAQLLLMVPFILLKDALSMPDNLAGMEAGPAMLGFSLLLLGLFHLVFFPLYYRDVSKVGLPFLLSMALYTPVMVALESFTYFVPFFRDVLDTRGGAFLPQKLLILLGGGLAYLLLTALAFRLSVKRFETGDQ